MQVSNGHAIIRCNTESRVLVRMSHVSMSNYSSLAVVIVVHYCLCIQNSVLTLVDIDRKSKIKHNNGGDNLQ